MAATLVLELVRDLRKKTDGTDRKDPLFARTLMQHRSQEWQTSRHGVVGITVTTSLIEYLFEP